MHQIQRLMHERVMFGPIFEPATLHGIGPRVEESVGMLEHQTPNEASPQTYEVYLRALHGQRFGSTTAVAPMTEAFVRNVEATLAAGERTA
jgi:hypothetical protein